MIRRLPKDVIDRIAAGEVIERPASVVKELIENALDAGATKVRVELEAGGRTAIRVRDDGRGMDLQDLRLAFAPHATSKLGDVDDLLSIGSYGFRGEALASIGTVSQARIVTRARGSEEGHEIRCDGGTIGEPKPAGAPVGTLVEARQLFFNVPARARFLKGEAAEAARCLEVVARFAMVCDEVGFELLLDGRSALDVPPSSSPRERAAALMGDDAANGLIETKARTGGVAIESLLGLPDSARASATHQYVFLNGRVIKDSTVKAAVRQAYREFLAPSLQPVYVLKIAIDPAEVDVNVHPAKSEVRFRDSSAVFRAVHGSILEVLRGSDLAARPRGEPSALPRPAFVPPPPRGIGSLSTPGASPAPARGLPRVSPSPVLPGFHAAPQTAAAASLSADRVAEAPIAAPTIPTRTGHGFLRVFETYIVYEAGDGLAFIDQHALHERVIYERLRAALDDGPLPAQRLLAPIALEVGRAKVTLADDRAHDFARVGLEVTPLNPTTLGIHTMPALLRRGDLRGMLDAILGAEDDGGKAGCAPLEERLHTMACHAAVRAGDVLNDGEVEELLSAAERMPEAKACPHGRPTVVRVGRGDLERWFRRSGF